MADTDDDGIYFHVSMSDVDSRSVNTTAAGSLNDGFYASAICPEDDPAKDYFSNLPVKPLEDRPGYFGVFRTDEDLLPQQCVWPTTRHGKQGRLKFFAFYPSRDSLKKGAEADDTFFALANKSKSGAAVTYDYRMTNFKLHKDISRHADFVTATAEGSKAEHGEKSLNLAFEHQLSCVAFKAWGNFENTEIAEIEIVGVRIGNAITKSEFNFTEKPTNLAQGDATVNGNWVAPQSKGVVEYGVVEYIFHEGESVVLLDGNSYKTEAAATSIMGDGGWAMMIPNDNTGWNRNNGGLYFSVLLRVFGKEENRPLLYPYIEGTDMNSGTTSIGMNVVYFAVDKTSGRINKRLYRNREDKKFYEDPKFEIQHKKLSTENINNYGWAAIPLGNLRWKPGYQYTYLLNYSGGVGVEDPADLFPGKPIISKIMVGVTESGTPWHTVTDYENVELDLDKKE